MSNYDISSYGFKKTQIDDLSEWIDALKNSSQNEVDSVMVDYGFQAISNRSVSWDSSKMVRVLENTPVVCQDYNEEVFHKILSYTIKKNFTNSVQ